MERNFANKYKSLIRLFDLVNNFERGKLHGYIYIIWDLYYMGFVQTWWAFLFWFGRFENSQGQREEQIGQGEGLLLLVYFFLLILFLSSS